METKGKKRASERAAYAKYAECMAVLKLALVCVRAICHATYALEHSLVVTFEMVWCVVCWNELLRGLFALISLKLIKASFVLGW